MGDGDDDDDDHEAMLSINVKRKSKKKSGFEVELRDDGHYYIIKVPPGYKDIGVGDRVVSINGTSFPSFKGEKHANDLFDSFKLEV
jgi:hypothetical protein